MRQDRETDPIPVPASAGERIVLDLSDREAAAEFLELVAKLVRAQGRITISVE